MAPSPCEGLPPWQPPAPCLPGPHAGCRLDRCLGRGGMGVVWSCFSKDMPHVPQAVKFLLGDESSAGLLALFRREAERGIRVNHQFLARTYALLDLRPYRSEGWPPAALVMHRYPLSLSDLLHRLSRTQTPLPWKAALRFAGNIALVLDFLDSHHALVHRDVKPSNILLEVPEGRRLAEPESLRWAESLLADLGVACSRDRPAPGLYQDGWKAPELFQDGLPRLDRTAHPAEDVYGFGRVLFALADALDPAEGLAPQLAARARMCTVPEPAGRPRPRDLLGLLLPLTPPPDPNRQRRAQELGAYPDRPRLDLAPDPDLVAAYCRATNSDWHLACAVVEQANDLRAEVRPGAAPLELSELPTRFAESKVFWWQTFETALYVSGQAAAALLLVQGDAGFDARARDARERLLSRLREEKDVPEAVSP